MKLRDMGYAVFAGLLLGSLFPPFRFEALVRRPQISPLP